MYHHLKCALGGGGDHGGRNAQSQTSKARGKAEETGKEKTSKENVLRREEKSAHNNSLQETSTREREVDSSRGGKEIPCGARRAEKEPLDKEAYRKGMPVVDRGGPGTQKVIL